MQELKKKPSTNLIPKKLKGFIGVCLPIFVCTVCVQSLWRSEENIESLGTGITVVMSCLMWVMGTEP